VKHLRLAFWAMFVALAAGCSPDKDDRYEPSFGAPPTKARPEYVFAVLPVQNPAHLFKIYAPLIDYLNSNIDNAHFQLQASRSFADFEKKLYARHFHIAIPNPYETVNAVRHGYRVIGKMGNDDNFRGVILVRRDSKIKQIQDLRGKTVSFPAPTALAAALMPQFYLHNHGIDINHDIKLMYSGSHDSTIMNVYLGNASAGAVWQQQWQAFTSERSDIASQLEMRWQTGTLPDNGLVVRDDVPEAVIEQVKNALFTLHQSADGRQILATIGTSHFEAADDKRYDVVREFIQQFTQQVRPLEPGT
jgi:phosphonate transport system substrate-binding protein